MSSLERERAKGPIKIIDFCSNFCFLVIYVTERDKLRFSIRSKEIGDLLT